MIYSDASLFEERRGLPAAGERGAQCVGRDITMAKLNQIIAVEKGIKSRSFQELTEAHHGAAEAGAAGGHLAHLPPEGRGGRAAAAGIDAGADQGGRHHPPDRRRPDQALRRDRDQGLDQLQGPGRRGGRRRRRCSRDVPVTYLLFLEKQLVDLHTFVKKLPVLDASETWVFDASADCLGHRAGADRQDQEGPAQPRQGRGDRQASRPRSRSTTRT